MFNATLNFIESNIDLIEAKRWRVLFVLAYEVHLRTREVQEIDEVLREADLFDSVDLRNSLLFEYLKYYLDDLRILVKDTPYEDRSTHQTYVAQFLRYYLNNTFGFTEPEAIEFMRDNQKLLNIKLVPLNKTGANVNYIIHFEN